MIRLVGLSSFACLLAACTASSAAPSTQQQRRIASTKAQYGECLAQLEAGTVGRCELEGDVNSAVVRATPGLAKQFPQFADQFVGDHGVRVPMGWIGYSRQLAGGGGPSGGGGGGVCKGLAVAGHANALVLSSARILNLYWGSYWSMSPGYYNMIAQDLTWKTIANDPRYYQVLMQYSTTGHTIGPGSWVGHDPGIDTTVSNPTLANDTFISKGDLEAELVKEAAYLPPDQATNTIYVIYLPPGASTPDLEGGYGFHGTVFADAHDPKNKGAQRAYFYAVVGFFADSITDGVPNFDTMNRAESHEIDETITDPDLINGWHFGQFELADLCSTRASDFLTYTIQQVWSNSACSCVDRLPQPPTPTAPQRCSIFVGCNDTVTVDCDLIDEAVVLQRLVNGSWNTVSSDTTLPRFHIPFLSDQPTGASAAMYRACGTNSHNDLACAPILMAALPHTPCTAGGGKRNCGGRNQPRCKFASVLR